MYRGHLHLIVDHNQLLPAMKSFRSVPGLSWLSGRKSVTSDRQNSISVPPPPQFLLEHREDIASYYPQRVRGTDSALATVYRIYAAILGGKDLSLRTELEYFFNHKDWVVSKIPDPKDPDPARYAVVAAVTYVLVASFNKLIGMGLPRGAPAVIDDEIEARLKAQDKKWEIVPGWASKAPICKEPLLVPDGQGVIPTGHEDINSDPFMLEKNVWTTKLPIYFI